MDECYAIAHTGFIHIGCGNQNGDTLFFSPSSICQNSLRETTSTPVVGSSKTKPLVCVSVQLSANFCFIPLKEPPCSPVFKWRYLLINGLDQVIIFFNGGVERVA